MSSLFSSNAANWTSMPPCGCGYQYYRAVKMEWHAHPMGVFVTDTEDTVHHAVAVFFVCGKCDKENRSTYTITSDGKESRWGYYGRSRRMFAGTTVLINVSYEKVEDIFRIMREKNDLMDDNGQDWARAFFIRVAPKSKEALAALEALYE
ncbi:hypothetical protein GPALN_013345 [Globodera pallida]|nr:hypothetical protein GPALN_013345 [Globodera pallida]